MLTMYYMYKTMMNANNIKILYVSQSQSKRFLRQYVTKQILRFLFVFSVSAYVLLITAKDNWHLVTYLTQLLIHCRSRSVIARWKTRSNYNLLHQDVLPHSTRHHLLAQQRDKLCDFTFSLCKLLSRFISVELIYEPVINNTKQCIVTLRCYYR
jgi:hypothetical protein